MKAVWKTHLVRLMILETVLALTLTLSLFLFHSPRHLSVVIYAIAALTTLAIYALAMHAHRRGLLPLGIPIKPIRPSTSRESGAFYLGPEARDAVASGQDRVIEDYIETSRSLIQSSRFEEAAGLLGKALEIDPVNSRLLNYLGICLSRMSRYEEAVRTYRTSIEQDYDNASAHFNLAVALENSEHISEALDQYRRYLKIGKIVGEPKDMLERAVDRLRRLQGG